MPRFERTRHALGTAALLASACRAEPAQVLWALDAGTPAADSGMTARAGAAAPPSSEPLSLQLETSGATPACDGCANLSAHVTGGTAPYTFVWSDPSLMGAGPHSICPRTSTTYIALVTDSVGALTVQATQVLCDPSPAASVDMTDAAPECSVRAALDVGTTCESDFAGIPLVRSFQLSTPLVAGSPYQLDLELRDLQFQLSIGLVAEIYGAHTPCMREQLLGTVSVQADIQHYDFCLFADQAYPYLVTVQRQDSLSIELAAVEALSLCPGCSASSN